jgi:type VI secretion system (T6SS) effector Tae4 (amidase)
MESFLNVIANRERPGVFADPPVGQIMLNEGETKILALKTPGSFNVAQLPYSPFWVTSSDWSVAICQFVWRLKDKTKVHYLDNYNYDSVMSDAELLVSTVGSQQFVFVQILGIGRGACRLSTTSSSYAQPVTITVLESKKLLTLTPGAPFTQLWANHPLNTSPPAYRNPLSADYDHCDKQIDPDPKHKEDCMTRLCMALKHSGIDLSGLRGKKTCSGAPPLPIPPKHAHHFVNSDDFETWQTTNNAYVFRRSSAQPEPMPGLAALWYMQGKTGIVVFKNFTHKDMHGGHVDLWDGHNMGNEFPPHGQQKTFFLRSQQIDFWPVR